MMHGDTSLWESFPRALERRTGTRRYVGAFRAPFQDLRLTPSQEHALRVCSLLAIPPPPPEQKALPGGVPEDLSQDNLSTWVDTVQDVAAGMIVPQPGTDQIIFPQVVEILTLLESVSRVAFCRQCYLPGSACRCLESSSTASTASTTGLLWSDIADPTFGTNPVLAGRGAGSVLPYGSSATAGGSIWDLPSTDFPGLPGAPSAICQPRPPAGVQGAARDMGGARDSSGRSGRVASREPRTARSCSKKRRRSQSRRRDSRPTVPFPLQEHEGRLQALRTLYEEAGEHRLASEMTALRGLQESHPEMGAEELQCLNNQVLLMIAEYHLMSTSQGTHRILPVLLEGAARLMPPVDEYLPGSFDGCRDVRVTDRAQILRVATWLHRLDLTTTYGVEIAASPRVEDYDFGPLLEYFLMPKLSNITLQEVAARVAQENHRDMETSLRDLHDERDSLRNGIELLTSARDNEQQRERKKTIKKQLDSRRRELRSNQQRISRLEELLGLEQPQEPPTAQGPLDVIVEETTEMTVMTDEETESEATPLGGPTDEATTPVRETEQDMETEGEGGNSLVTPNEDDLLTGAGAADVETGIASLHVDSPAKPRGDDDAAT